MAPSMMFRRRVANEASNDSLQKKKEDSSMNTSVSSTRTETTVGTDVSDETREDRSLSEHVAFYDDDDEDWRNDFLSPGSAIVKDFVEAPPHPPLSPVASCEEEEEDDDGEDNKLSSPTCVMQENVVEPNQPVLETETPKQNIKAFDDYSVPLNNTVPKEGSIWSDNAEKDAPKSPPRRHHRHRSMTAVTFLDTAPLKSPSKSPTNASTPTTKPPKHRRSSSLTYQKPPPRSPVSPSAPLTLESLHATREMRAQRFGPCHYTVGQTYNLIGNAHFRKQEYEMAILAYQQALKCTEGGESDHIAAAYGNIGTVCWSTGDLKLSVDCLEKALKLRKETEKANGGDPEKSITIASSYHQLGLARSLKQEYGKALVAFGHALKIRERVLGNKSIEVARTLDAIGKAHLYRGDADLSLSCHQTAYAIWFDISGGEHSPALTTSLMNIAAAQMALKDYEQATSSYLAVRNAQVAEIQKAAKEGNPNLLRLSEDAGETSQLLVDLFIKMGSFDNAQMAVEETLQLYQKASLSQDHPKMQALKESTKYLQKAALHSSGSPR